MIVGCLPDVVIESDARRWVGEPGAEKSPPEAVGQNSNYQCT